MPPSSPLPAGTRVCIVVALGLVSLPLSTPAAAQQSDPPPSLDDGWETATPAEVGLDADRLAALTRALRAGEFGNVHALLIEKSGKLVYEEYFTGRDETWGEDLGTVSFGRASLHDVRSVSKSVVSTLVGIAIDRGEIPSVDTPLHTLLPEYAHLLTGDKRSIRLQHVLSMSAGLAWDEWSTPYSDPTNDWLQLTEAEDPVAFVLDRELVDEPGAAFTYHGGMTHLLGVLLERATGEELEDHARRRLFEPLEIHDVVWRGEIGGLPSADAGLRLRARDLAKLGSVYLHAGRWNGVQVVPEAWVEKATLPRLATPLPESAPDFIAGFDYGYQWWLGRYRTAAGKLRVPMMAGNGEQRLMVVRELGVVLTVVAGEYGEVTWMPDRLLVEKVVGVVSGRNDR